MYQPKTGDHVLVTRVLADERTVRYVGRIADFSPHTGFRLIGHMVGGASIDSYFAASDTVGYPKSGVISQIIELAPEVAR
ncbi:hypothetical protein [Kitasatospora sp. NPDC057223]|uniref:hypothetical protein n=1 Tax=Kitasatospora sp. NPDC057223 TaxID=3346055 RepID=UPI0036442D03